MMHSKHGVSLLELLVSMLVGSMLLTVVVAAFVGTARLLGWVGARSDLAAAALVSVNSLGRELRSSNYKTLTVATSPSQVALSFEEQDPATVLNSSTLAQFQPAAWFVVYYYDGKDRLIRKTLAAGDPAIVPPAPAFGTVCRLSSQQLWRTVAVHNGTEEVVARGVMAATFNPATFPTQDLMNGLSISLTVQRDVTSTHTVQQQVLTTVYPRN
jgi:prepilin-type N-terminal cleavage/methylation domain-containing protein